MKISGQARTKNISNIEKLDKQDERLDGIIRVGMETKDTAQNTLTKMVGQKAVLLEANQDTGQIRSQLQQSKKVIARMSRKEFFFKCALWLAVLSLFAAILILLIFKLAKLG